MRIRTSSGSRLRLGGRLFSGIPIIGASTSLGLVYRVANTGGVAPASLTYTKIDGTQTSTNTLNPGDIQYILAVSGSLSDTPDAGSIDPGASGLTITNALITSSVEIDLVFSEQVLTTPGSGSWTKPLGITKVIVECWSGGGAGGGVTSNNSGGNGGAPGQYSRKLIIYPASPSTSVPYVIGAGGVGTTGNGPSGSSTTWDSTVVVTIGGAGGIANITDQSNNAEATTNGAVGDIVYRGSFPTAGNFIPAGALFPGSPAEAVGGNGGSGPGSSKNNNSTPTAALEYGGGGGSAQGVQSSGIDGQNASLYAAGGGGAAKVTGASRVGGNGTQGLIRVSYLN